MISKISQILERTARKFFNKSPNKLSAKFPTRFSTNLTESRQFALRVLCVATFTIGLISLALAFVATLESGANFGYLGIIYTTILMTVSGVALSYLPMLWLAKLNRTCPQCRANWQWHKKDRASTVEIARLVRLHLPLLQLNLQLLQKVDEYACKSCGHHASKVSKDYMIADIADH